ncbi:MAG: hypothetical protein QXV30_02445 [Desulfurococcaceae archaeon]
MLPRSKIIVLSIALGFFLGLFIIVSLPSTTPYSVVNEGSSGLSTLYVSLNAKLLYSLNKLSDFDSENTLLISARIKPVGEFEQLINFTKNGGTIVTYGSMEHVVDFLRELGIHTNFKGYVRDAVFNVGSLNTVVVNATHIEVVFENPYTLDGDFSDVNIVAWSSLFSHVDVNGNNFYDLDEPIGSFPLGVEIALGKGEIIVLFTERLLENSLLIHNLDFIKTLARGKTVVVDQSEIVLYPIEVLRAQLAVQRDPVNAYVVISLIALLSVVAYFVIRK